jgi:hypothetical protein
MLRWLPAGIFVLIFLLAAVISVSAKDTGAYRIPVYTVSLEPQNDGRVKMTYFQEWEVISGHIPWVTVGLPNSNYSVRGFEGSASKVTTADSGSWTGVRVDLDKDYLPGETFQIGFTVLQGNILERLTSEKKWRINFTPGWYDMAEIGRLEIKLVSPVDINSYSLIEPQALSMTDNNIIWGESISARWQIQC